MKSKSHVNTHVFPNGFRMIHQKPTNDLKMTAIYCYCDVGSVFEKEGVRGVSHLVEHMCFKGTKKIPDPRDIFLTYDKIGARFNAFTEKRVTCYTVKCEDEFVFQCSNILADMLLHSTFPKKLFEKEQKVVLEENIRNENNMHNILGEKIDAIIYQSSSYEYPIDTLTYHMVKTNKKYNQEKDISYANLVNWYRSFYIPSNFVFSIVSNLTFEKIKIMLSKSMFTKPVSVTPPFFFKDIRLTLQPITDKMRIFSIPKKGVSTHVIMIGFRTCSRFSNDRFCFKILSHILNGMSGRLFTILREKHGLTYSSVCVTESLDHTGCALIITETSPEHTIHVLTLLIQLCMDLKKKGITEQEFLVAKGNIRGNYILKTEMSDTLAAHNGKEFILQPNLETFTTYDNMYSKNIKPITIKKVNQVIQTYFTIENMVIGIVGIDPPSESKIREISKRFI